MSGTLTPAERITFAGLADILVPAAEGMPSASAVDIAGRLLDQVLNYRPDLRADILRIVRTTAATPPADAIANLMAHDPEAFASLGLVVAGGYYLSPTVKQLLAYPGQERRTIDPDETPAYIANGMLARVIARGPIWQDPANPPAHSHANPGIPNP